ncbi:hypothetical protein [uncultured Erythrobacter sp.]|uniref:hypothetical protein n=1 Tax=uncultured Erythrobacter sp. TaxID=263913 RepID=UPI002629AFED|nr:hypothetical protein [uncultured Erythrobacter sp.]
MAQVNVAYDDALLAHIDAVAEDRGTSRPELLRAIAEETVRANEQGRAMFEPLELPIDPETAITLATKVEQISIDLDRILRAAERREHKMLKAFNATEEANRNATDRLGDELSKRFTNGATPFAEMLAEHLEQVEQLRKDILAAARSPEWLAEIEAKLAVLEAAVKEPRSVNRYEIAPNWRLPAWQWCMVAVAALFAAAVVITTLARLTPDGLIATPMSRAMYGSADQGICELWKAKNDFDACPVLVPMSEEPAP